MYDHAYTGYLNRMKGAAIILGLLLIIIGGLLAFLCVPVSASITENNTISVIEETSHSISWNYTYHTENRPTGATLDGIEIERFKTDYVLKYTASELESNTTHEFCLFDNYFSNCESGTTIPEAQTDLDRIFNAIYLYIFAVVAIVLLVLSIKMKQPEIALVSGLLAFVGFGIIGENLIGQIIYALVLISAFYLTFKE